MNSFGCPLCCHQIFNSVVALREHLLYFTFRPLLCVLCGVTIGGIYELTRHLETHLIRDKNPKSEYIESKSYMGANNVNSNNVDKNKYLEGVISEEDLSNDLPDTHREYINEYKDFTPNTDINVPHEISFEQTDIEQPSPVQPDSTDKTFSFTNYSCWENPPGSIDQATRSSKSDSYSDTNFGTDTLSIFDPSDEEEILDEVEPPVAAPKDLSIKYIKDGDAVRAFVCHECGAKVVGKDYYFNHLKEHSYKALDKDDGSSQDHLPSVASVHETYVSNSISNISEHVASHHINNNKLDLPVYSQVGNNNNSFRRSPDLPFYTEVKNNNNSIRSSDIPVYTELGNNNSIRTSDLPVYTELGNNNNNNNSFSSSDLAVCTEIENNNNDDNSIRTSYLPVDTEIGNNNNTFRSTDLPIYTEIGNNKNNNNNDDNSITSSDLPIYTEIRNTKIIKSNNEYLLNDTSRQNTNVIKTQSYVSETSDILDLTREDSQRIVCKSENVTSSLKIPMNNSSLSPMKPYIHKKFDHDHERKFEGLSSDRDVQCYIQNFQSLLVNKLNEVSETGAVPSPRPVTSGMILANETEEKNIECENVQRNSSQYQCKYCLKKFIFKQTRDTHELNRKCSVIKKCKFCDKIFSKSNLLERHEQEVHFSQVHYCDICGRHFKSYRFLVNHKGIHDTKKFNCKQCQYVVHTASGLRSHIAEHHSSKVKEIVCEFCGESFKRKYGLKRHIERKHNDQKYSCKYCDKEFSCEVELSSHLNTHLNSESFRCKMCEVTFSKQSSLKRHIIEKHSETSNAFKCNTCLISFSRKDSLLSHLKLHSKDRKYVCKCGKGFNKLSHLKYHSAKHTREPLYQCGRCSKSYKFKPSLRTHKCDDG